MVWIAGNEIFAKHEGSFGSIVNTFTSNSEFTPVLCSGFVLDSNLDGWKRRVRAKDNVQCMNTMWGFWIRAVSCQRGGLHRTTVAPVGGRGAPGGPRSDLGRPPVLFARQKLIGENFLHADGCSISGRVNDVRGIPATTPGSCVNSTRPPNFRRSRACVLLREA